MLGTTNKNYIRRAGYGRALNAFTTSRLTVASSLATTHSFFCLDCLANSSHIGKNSLLYLSFIPNINKAIGFVLVATSS